MDGPESLPQDPRVEPPARRQPERRPARPQRASPGSWEIRPYRAGDEHAILALHRRAYIGQPERTLAHWRWRYVQNPVRTTEAILAVAPDGRCLGVAAGIAVRWMLEGTECRGRLGGDTAVDPDLRRGLAGGRIVRAVLGAMHDAFPCRMAWGFPEPQVLRLGLRLMRWSLLRDVSFLVRESAGGARGATVPGVEVAPVERFAADVEELWQTCAPQVGTGTVRDRDHLNWRYADHPDIGYTLLEARADAGGRLRGLAVVRQGGWSPEVLSLMDWLVPDGDEEAEQALVEAVLDLAARSGRSYVCGWFAGNPPEARRLQQRHRFFSHTTPYQVSYVMRGPARARGWLQACWRQTMGDIDFF